MYVLIMSHSLLILTKTVKSDSKICLGNVDFTTDAAVILP